MITQGGLMAMQRLGVRLGETVRVATHANSKSPALLGWEDRVTRIEFDLDVLVRLLLETLDALTEGTVEQRFTFDAAEGIAPEFSYPERYDVFTRV